MKETDALGEALVRKLEDSVKRREATGGTMAREIREASK